MVQPTTKKQAKCPACGATLTFTTALKFEQIIECTSCDARLEIISLDPLELDWAFEDDDYDHSEDDDYDYDEDDEDDYEEDDDYDYDEDDED
ncbi:MAG: hypothetical protein IAE79_29005 [Anaerolinea sp.]|nr:hypothetical protein [Anaerolinea sp.]